VTSSTVLQKSPGNFKIPRLYCVFCLFNHLFLVKSPSSSFSSRGLFLLVVKFCRSPLSSRSSQDSSLCLFCFENSVLDVDGDLDLDLDLDFDLEYDLDLDLDLCLDCTSLSDLAKPSDGGGSRYVGC